MCTLGTAVVLEQGSNDEDEEFWGYLGSGEIGSPVSEEEEPEEFSPVLYRVDGDPTKDLEKVSAGSPVKKGSPTTCLPKSALEDSDVFLVDAGWEVFVWIGSGADIKEKIAALGAADRLAEIEPRVNYLPVTVVKSGSETDDFLSYFD
jgi:hypothetical protein